MNIQCFFFYFFKIIKKYRPKLKIRNGWIYLFIYYYYYYLENKVLLWHMDDWINKKYCFFYLFDF